MRPLILLLSCLLAGLLQAHPTFQNPAWIEYDEKEILLTVHVSAKEICTVADIPIGENGQVEQPLVIETAPKHAEYFLKHFVISANGKPLQGNVIEIKEPVTWVSAWDGADLSHFVWKISYPCPEPPQRISVFQNMMAEFSYNPTTQFNFNYVIRWYRKGKEAADFGPLPFGGTFDIATEFAPDAPKNAAEAEEQSTEAAWTRFKRFLVHGITHVLTGYDHLLFAAALVLALRRFWEIFKIIAVFTIAHTITVTLTAYKILPEMRWVEPVIAASIVYVALENIFAPKLAQKRPRLLIAFAFGLVHGMGLAGTFIGDLQEFSGSMIAWAIVAFCLGVEIGHLIVVTPLSTLLALGRNNLGHEAFSIRAQRWGSAFIAIAGIYYFSCHMGWVPEQFGPDALFGGA